MYEYDFTVKRGDTFNGKTFTLSTYMRYATLASLPTVGTAGVIYYVTSTALYYKWDTDTLAYVETTDVAYIDLTDAEILCQFRRKYDGTVYLELTQEAGITISDATGGTFKLDAQVIDLEGCDYLYDIQITFSSGEVKTYIGGVLTVEEDVSRNE